MTTRKINSVREALKFVKAEFEHDKGEITGVQIKCRGCGEPAYFTVHNGPARSIGDSPIEALFEFASRHAVCAEIKSKLPHVPTNDDVWETEGRFNTREPKRLY